MGVILNPVRWVVLSANDEDEVFVRAESGLHDSVVAAVERSVTVHTNLKELRLLLLDAIESGIELATERMKQPKPEDPVEKILRESAEDDFKELANTVDQMLCDLGDSPKDVAEALVKHGVKPNFEGVEEYVKGAFDDGLMDITIEGEGGSYCIAGQLEEWRGLKTWAFNPKAVTQLLLVRE